MKSFNGNLRKERGEDGGGRYNKRRRTNGIKPRRNHTNEEDKVDDRVPEPKNKRRTVQFQDDIVSLPEDEELVDVEKSEDGRVIQRRGALRFRVRKN